MASVVTKYAPKLKFQYQDFEIMNIPNLMIIYGAIPTITEDFAIFVGHTKTGV